MEKTNEILTIAGKRVRYSKDVDTCSKCCLAQYNGVAFVCPDSPHYPCKPFNTDPELYAYFVPAEESEPKNWPADKDNLVGKQAVESVDRWVVTNAFLKCERAGSIIKEMYGDKFNNVTPNKKKYLTFLTDVELEDRMGELADILRKYGAMPAEEIEGTPQKVTLIPSNEDEDEAAEMAARRAYPYEEGTKGDICEASIPIFCKGFKAGIAWERERKMQRVGEEWGDKVAENPEIIFSTDGELTVYSFVGAPRWWATIREAEEALSVFKAGICWRKAQMEKRITLIQKSWYEQGKIDGKYEGLTDDEKYQQGAFDERERLMKEAVEIDTDITINRYTKRHILHISSTDEHIQHLPQGEYKVIIIKKEK